MISTMQPTAIGGPGAGSFRFPACGAARISAVRRFGGSAVPAGFSLTEMLTAISLLLFIMLGVAVVFSNVSQALRIALGNSYAIRSKMDIAHTLKSDIENISPDGFLAIVNMRALAFQDQNDRDTNGNAAFNGLVTRPDQAYDPSLAQNTDKKGYGKRWFRCDLLSFCATGYFADQVGTSATGQLLYQNPGLGAYEAWVTWGNAAVDTGVGGTGANSYCVNMSNNSFTLGNWQPNNLANDWSLARRVVLLAGKAQTNILNNMSFRPAVLSNVSAQAGLQLFNNPGTDVATCGTSSFNLSGSGALQYVYRPRAMIKASGLPLTREDSARTSVTLANSVSDFAVEFAGDYLNQPTALNTNTSSWRSGQDGEVDFAFIDQQGGSNYRNLYTGQMPPRNLNNNGSGPNLPNAIFSRCTLWYGLHATWVDIYKPYAQTPYALWAPPIPANTVYNGMFINYAPPKVPFTQTFPNNVMTQPGDSGTVDMQNVYGPAVPPSSSPLQWYMAAAFSRDNPSTWPRMLRISYRVHAGATGDDPGTVIQNVYHLPSAR